MALASPSQHMGAWKRPSSVPEGQYHFHSIPQVRTNYMDYLDVAVTGKLI